MPSLTGLKSKEAAGEGADRGNQGVSPDISYLLPNSGVGQATRLSRDSPTGT